MVHTVNAKISVFQCYINKSTNNKSCRCQNWLWMTSNMSITGPTHQFLTVSFMQNAQDAVIVCHIIIGVSCEIIWGELRKLVPRVPVPVFLPSRANIGNQGMGKLTCILIHNSVCCLFHTLLMWSKGAGWPWCLYGA